MSKVQKAVQSVRTYPSIIPLPNDLAKCTMDIVFFTFLLANGVTFLVNQNELAAMSTLEFEEMPDRTIPLTHINTWEPTLEILTQAFDLVRNPDTAIPTQFIQVYKLLDFLGAPDDIKLRLDNRISAMDQTPFATIEVIRSNQLPRSVSITLEDTLYLKYITLGSHIQFGDIMFSPS